MVYPGFFSIGSVLFFPPCFFLLS